MDPTAAVAKKKASGRQYFSTGNREEDLYADINEVRNETRAAWKTETSAPGSRTFQVERICDSGAAIALGFVDA